MANYVCVMIKMLYLYITSTSLAAAVEHGKRHALGAHMPEAATDWLNPLPLGTMSASAYIDNLA